MIAMMLVTTLVVAAPAASANTAVLKVAPHHLSFGSQAFDTFTVKTITITNISRAAVLVGFVDVFVPDDFSPGQPESTCPLPDETLVAAGESCTQVVGYSPAREFAGHEAAAIRVTARDPQSGKLLDSVLLHITGRGVAP